jgi:hypothetical protein
MGGVKKSSVIHTESCFFIFHHNQPLGYRKNLFFLDVLVRNRLMTALMRLAKTLRPLAVDMRS